MDLDASLQQLLAGISTSLSEIKSDIREVDRKVVQSSERLAILETWKLEVLPPLQKKLDTAIKDIDRLEGLIEEKIKPLEQDFIKRGAMYKVVAIIAALIGTIGGAIAQAIL